MDKSDRKKQEELLKSSFMQGMSNPAAFLDAASLLAQWGGARDNPFLPFPGLGMMPSPSGNHQMTGFDKNSQSAMAMNQNWYAMAQMAAQDYFSRLQMSGMMHPDLANAANLAALGNLGGFSNPTTSSSPSSNKNNSKRKDKSDSYDKLDVKKLSKETISHSNNPSYSQFSNTSNLQKDFMVMAAAAAASFNNVQDLDSHNDSTKSKSSSQSNYVPNKNSNSNPNSSKNNSNSRKKDSEKYNIDNNYSSKRSDLRVNEHSNYQNMFKESNNTSLLGVRLPPDTEIIKYTSSGSKMPMHNSFNQSDLDIHISPKRKKVDNYDSMLDKQKNDMVEVIKLPSNMSSNGSLDQKTSNDADKYGMKESTDNTSDDGPLNLSMKSSFSSSSSKPLINDLTKNDNDLPGVNNLSNLQNLTAGIGMFSNDSKNQHKEGRPRNLGRGVSKPKKNTVASLLAQSRAVGIKPQQLLNSNCDLEKVRQAIMEVNSDVHSNTDSESYNDTSGISESDGENDNFNLNDLKEPLMDGWKRETIIKGLTRTGALKGDVQYYSPYNPTIKITNMNQLKDELAKNNCPFNDKNFSFSARRLVGTFLQAAPPNYATDGDYVKMTDYEVAQRLEEIRMYTRQPALQLNVEQRIEIARQQQALRDAKKIIKDEVIKTKEKQKHMKDLEKCEKYELQRKEKELKTFQQQEARRKKEEDAAKLKMEEQRRKQEEKERKRQHAGIIKQLEFRRKYEEREKKRHLMLLEKLISREQKLSLRKLDAQILSELRKPKEDSEIMNKIEIPTIPRIGGLKLSGQGFADLLMAFEFLHNFGETLGFDMESLPTLQSLHNAISQENAIEAEEELLSVITHLLVCAIEDPGIPNPNRHVTLLGQTLRQADITHQNVSEILRIYLYSVATGEVRQQTGICFERDKSSRFVDLHQNDCDEKPFTINSKNTQYFEILHENERYKLSESLKDKPYVALNPTVKAQILGMLCNDLLLNKAVCRQIENGLESQAVLKREKFLLDNKVRKYKGLLLKRQRIEQYEKSQQMMRKSNENTEDAEKDMSEDKEDTNMESQDATKVGVPNKPDDTRKNPNVADEKLDDDNNNSEEESEDLEEDEDTNMTADEVQKKLEKIMEQCFQTKQQLHKSLSSLRGKHYGQDRFWRRYWFLPKCGGIYVEGLESAERELLKYQTKLEEIHGKSECDKKQNSSQEIKVVPEQQTPAPMENEIISNENSVKEEQGVPEFKHIEHVMKNNPINICKSLPELMQQKNENSADFDIEDSIPTAILVQKASKSDDSRFVEINHVVPMQKMEEENCAYNSEKEEPKLTINTNDEIKKEALDENEAGMKNVDDIKSEMEGQDEECEKIPPKYDQLLSKWFSLIDNEIPLLTSECPIIAPQVDLYKNIQCKEEIIMHGHQWEIQNNLHFYNPKIYWENNDNEIEFRNDSVLSTSGLDLTLLEKSLDGRNNDIPQKNNNIPSGDNCTIGDYKRQCLDDPLNGKIFIYDQHHCFNLPPIQNMTINNLSVFVQCENLNAAQMTPDEQEAVDEVKKNGMRKSTESILVPKDLRHGWFKISEIEDMNEVIKSLHPKGVREKVLRQNLMSALSESIDLTVRCPVSNARAPPPPNGFIEPEPFNVWNPRIAKRVEQQLLDQVEGLEDKIANASMQIKGWNAPQRDNDSESDILESIDINLIRDRILNLEGAIERRYLKPPLGNNTTEAQLLINASIGSEPNISASPANRVIESPEPERYENVPKGLASWREAVTRSVTAAQLSMALYTLEQCVAWDKSIMKANCQFCQSGESEDKLLLCDSCDRGYHTYCFKPKLEKIPEGDWFCFECINKVTGERKCIICGGLRPQPVGKLIFCELCPRAYHHDCYIPPMLKVPRGKWYCSNCISKAPPKKKPVRKPKDLKSHNSSHSLDSSHEEAAPNSPSASLTSFSIDDQATATAAATNTTTPTTLNNTMPNLNVSDVVIPVASTPTIAPVTKTDTSMTNNEENEPEVSDLSTQNSPVKDNKERDDLKEKLKAEKKAAKKLMKELAICKIILEEMEVHEASWPFLLPVNTKQFPTYKKVIKHPMDLSTIKKRLQDIIYKSREDFVLDVRQIFDNCEVFNEDDSPVGKAGHEMRKYFELRWAELTEKHS